MCSVEGGELFDRVITIKEFPEDDAKMLFYQMMLAIKVSSVPCAVYLTSQPVVHA